MFEYLQGKEISKKDLEICLKIIAPFAPHLAEEFWEKNKFMGFVAFADWAKFNEKKINNEFENEEKIVEALISDVLNVLRIVKEKNENPEKLFVYTIPKEKETFANNSEEIERRINLKTKVFAVNDKVKHDPQNKSGKAKLGKPAIYLE